MDVKAGYDFEVKWDKKIKAAYDAGGPEDTKLVLLGAIRAVFPIFVPGPTGAANAKQYPEGSPPFGSGAFVSSQELPGRLSGWYRLVVENDTAKLHNEGEDKVTLDVLWTGKGQQHGLDGNWRVFFQPGDAPI